MRNFIYSTILLLTACYNNEQSRDNKVIHKYKRRVIINKTDTLAIPKLGRYAHVNDIPPRYQWESNGGYCGEISLKSAGLYYGQYISQFDVRKIICGKDQMSCELLLGVNAKNAAHKLKLKYKTKQCKDSKNFLKWVKEHVLLGYPVIIGVMNNEHILYGNKNPNAGDSNYDHIVPVIGIGSSHPLDDKYYENDHMLFSDNGLVTNNGNNPAIPKNNNVPYYYHYSFEEFVGSREKANEPNGDLYTLVNLPKNERGDSIFNYAIAITGIMGKKKLYQLE